MDKYKSKGVISKLSFDKRKLNFNSDNKCDYENIWFKVNKKEKVHKAKLLSPDVEISYDSRFLDILQALAINNAKCILYIDDKKVLQDVEVING